MHTKPLHSTQRIISEVNGLHLEIECYLTPELEMTILSYAEKVKVLAPVELRDRVKKRAEAMAEVYKTN